MRNLLVFAAACVLPLSLTSTSLAQTNITNNITSNTTWDVAGSPYIIQNSINVQNGVSLTVDAGVEIKFNGSFSISVLGEIKAVGASTDSIYITSNLANPKPLDWDRILIQGAGSDNSEFKYCRIEFGRVGVSFEDASAKISNSTIESCHDAAITVVDGSPIVEHNVISRIRHSGTGISTGIHIASGSPLIIANDIHDNDNGITTDFANSYIAKNRIYENLVYGIDNRNADDQNKLATIENNTIDHNGLIGRVPFAANINCDNSSPIIKNNIITNSEHVPPGTFGAGIRVTSGGSPQVSYNNVWNNAGGNYTGGIVPGVGDISSDPKFVDPSNGDYHLQFNSPCIDMADPNSPPDPDGTRADMGALFFHQLVADAGPDSVGVLFGSSVQIGGSPTANGGTPPYTFSWSPGISLDDSTIANPTATPIDTTTYVVSVTDANGSTDTDAIRVDVIPLVLVDITPINPPIQIPAIGGAFQFTISITNNSASTQSFQVWNMVTPPSGEPIGPTLGPFNPTLASGEIISKVVTQEVPSRPPAGAYTYTFNVGTFPSTIDDSDSFPFTKLGESSALQKSSSGETYKWAVIGAGDWEGMIAKDLTEILPDGFVLEPNYPNPFNPQTEIRFQLPEAGKVILKIFNTLGQEVRTFPANEYNAGFHSIRWDGKDNDKKAVATGIYLYQLQAGAFTQVKKMSLLR